MIKDMHFLPCEMSGYTAEQISFGSCPLQNCYPGPPKLLIFLSSSLNTSREVVGNFEAVAIVARDLAILPNHFHFTINTDRYSDQEDKRRGT